MNNTEKKAMELLPCPICGAEGEFFWDEDDGVVWHRAQCRNVCVSTRNFTNRTDPQRIWNTRQARSEYQAATANNGGAMREALGNLIKMIDEIEMNRSMKLRVTDNPEFNSVLVARNIAKMELSEALSAPPTAEGQREAQCQVCGGSGAVAGIFDVTDVRECHICTDPFHDDFSSYLEAFDAYFGGAMDNMTDDIRSDLFKRGQRYTDYVLKVVRSAPPTAEGECK